MAQTSACMYSWKRRTFWAFNLTPANAYINFCVLISWILNYCHCCKYIRVLLLLISCIFQGTGSAMTYSNFVENLTVKEFWKSVNICWNLWLTVEWHSCFNSQCTADLISNYSVYSPADKKHFCNISDFISFRGEHLLFLNEWCLEDKSDVVFHILFI